MRTYKNTRRDPASFRYTLAAFLAGAVAAVPVVAFVPFPSPPECGYVFDSASVGYVPKACDADAFADRVDAIAAERPSGRFDDGYAECAALLAADDWDATGCVGDYPTLDARSRALWGPDGDPETGADK